MRGFISFIFMKIATMLTLMCGKVSLEKEMAAHSRILAWRITHGQRSLAGYSQWGHRVRHA